MDENFNSIENRNPFKFLDSYTKEDRDIFFGREAELEEIYRKFYKSKILLVYGKSGTGKSSLINCGLVSLIPSEDILIIPVRCGKDPVNNLKSDLKKFADNQNVAVNQKDSIIKIIEDIYLENFKPITLLFDQFEEIFILSSSEDRRKLIGELLKIINSKIRVNLVIIFREEYFASFSEFENAIPNLFENRVRIEKLNKIQVKEIVEKPCKICNVSIEPGLTEKITEILSQETGAIELTYFQILMDKLYKMATERSVEQTVLKNEDLLRIGDVGNILGDFLNSQLLEKENASDIEAVLKTMISEDGTKKRVTPEKIVDSLKTLEINISGRQVKSILQDLINSRILSEKDEQGFYEIKHDSLAQRIYDRLTADERKLKEIQLLLNNAFKQYEQVGSLISERTLRHVEPYEDKLVLTSELSDYLAKSKQTILRHKKKKRNIVIASISIAIIILSFFTSWNIIERKEAIKQRDRAKTEAQTAEQVSDFLVGLFEMSDPSEALGDTITAREILDKGAERIENELDDQPEVQATLMNTMGIVYINLGLYDRSIALLENAVNIRTQLFGEENLNVALSMDYLAQANHGRGDYDTAELLYKKSLEIRKTLLGDNDESVASSLNNLASLFENKSKYDSAEILYREAIRIENELFGMERIEVAIILINLGNSLNMKGKYNEAQQVIQQGIDIARKREGDESIHVASGLRILAVALGGAGKNSEAEAAFLEALKINKKVYGNEHDQYMVTLHNYAGLLTDMGKYSEADSIQRIIIQIYRKLYGNDHPNIAVMLHNFGLGLLNQNKPDEAEPILLESLEICSNFFNPDDWRLTLHKRSVGLCYYKQKRYSEAEPLFVESYPIFKAKFGEEHSYTKTSLEFIIGLYKAWDKPEKMAEYEAFLPDTTAVSETQ